MNVWAIQQDVAMDGRHFSRLVAARSFEYANFDLGIVNYRHLVAYFGNTIKQSYCMKFPIDETSEHFSVTAAQHYANYSNDHKFMGDQEMDTYKLAIEAWHCLLQLHGNPVTKPPSGASIVEVPTTIVQPNEHCPLQSQCASILVSLMYSVTHTPPQPALLPPPLDPTHEIRSLRALH